MTIELTSRVAWFTPLPPVRSGISAYSAELLPILAKRFDIDVYVDIEEAAPDGSSQRLIGPRRDVQNQEPSLEVLTAHDFMWKHRARPYDAIVYQIGNAACHNYMWPYLLRYPGIVVLHDGELHHARAAKLLHGRRFADYRAEFAWNHPDAPAGTPEYAVAGFGGPLYYLWTMLRVPAAVSRALVVHSKWLARDLEEEFPHIPVHIIPMGVADPLEGSESGLAGSEPGVAGSKDPALLARHGIPPDVLLFGSYGLMTPEKRISQIFEALAWLRSSGINAHLMLVGGAPPHYDPAADARRYGVADVVTVTGYVPDDRLAAYLAAADVCLALRWPTARETSASLLRCLAAGKPTITIDLAHTVDIPSLDPRTWTTSHDGGATAPEPVTIGLDILDEDHSLRLAVDRVARDSALRTALGASARAWWRSHHTLEMSAAGYVATIEAVRQEAPRRGDAVDLPAHLVDDGTAHARRLLRPFDLDLLGS